jgi:hypothetical protein
VSSQRLNISLDGDRAAKLSRLAERTHVDEETLARALLSSALDDADPDMPHVGALLDGLPDAFERAQVGLRQAQSGETMPLHEL